MRPVVPLQSPGHLSDSKLYSANSPQQDSGQA